MDLPYRWNRGHDPDPEAGGNHLVLSKYRGFAAGGIVKTLMALLAALLAFMPTASYAIEGGEEALGNPDVVALVIGDYATRPKCSAAFVEPMIVVTAAHCLTKLNSELGEVELEASSYWVSAPGENLNKPVIADRRQVAKIIRTPGYINMWRPSVGDFRTQKDDIAFLVLRKPATGQKDISLVSATDLARIKSEAMSITHLGYGLQGVNRLDGKPHVIELTAEPSASSKYPNHPALESNTITTNETGAKAICAGDSGSPWYATLDGVKKLVAVTVGGSGCGGTGVNGAIGTSVAGYSDLLASAQKEAAVILKKIQAQRLKESVRTFNSCKAMNKVFKGGIAKTASIALASQLTEPAFVSSVGFKNNSKFDKDKDGIACER